MMSNKQGKLRKNSALVLSVSLHGVLLLAAHYLRIKNASAVQTLSYSIELNTCLPQREKSSATTQGMLEKTQHKKEITAQSLEINQKTDLKNIVSKEIEKDNLATVPKKEVKDFKPSSTEQELVKDVFDERGLYSIAQNKKSSSLLELIGWVWDKLPQPKDNTDECGKLVFEITIDELGEIRAVKTLEKTVSPIVEQIYKESLFDLTFSKTSDNATYIPTFTGKITFILQAK